jgi:transposase-like protein
VRDIIANTDRKEEVEDEEESDGECETTVEFAHRCSNQECNHLIATHRYMVICSVVYMFTLSLLMFISYYQYTLSYIHRLDKSSNTEEELMECVLCGRGTSTRSNNALEDTYTPSADAKSAAAVEVVEVKPTNVSLKMSSSMQKAAAAYNAEQSSDDGAEWST